MFNVCSFWTWLGLCVVPLYPAAHQTHKYQVSIQPEKLRCSINPVTPRLHTDVCSHYMDKETISRFTSFQRTKQGKVSNAAQRTSEQKLTPNVSFREWRVCGDSRITDVFDRLTDIPLSSFCPYPAIRPQYVSLFFTVCYICNILFSQLEDKVTVIVPLQIYYYSIYLLILTNVHKRWLLIQQ